MLRRLLRKNEFILALTIVAFSLLVGIVNPAFFSIQNVFDVLRGSTVMGIFALGVLIVIISGGIDVSFAAIAIASMYYTVKFCIATGIQGPFVLIALMAVILGTLMGGINALFISTLKLPTLIVSLGTLSLIQGLMLATVGTTMIPNLPQAMNDFGKSTLIVLEIAGDRHTQLQTAILIPAILAVIVWILLKYTMLGRSIYALGGSSEGAERAGFRVRNTLFFIYCFVGCLSGLAGVTHASLARIANQADLVGSELNVIAAVVLGGARITGGHGSVIGTVLGVILVVLINNSLILLGIPSSWQQLVVGLIIIIGTGIPALQARRARRRLASAVG